MSELLFFAMGVTPFAVDGELDEDAHRKLMRRLVDARLGVYLGSGGNAEGLALSFDELRRLYRAGVEECRGRVPVHAHLPDQHTARGTIDHARLAIEGGVEVVHMYSLAGWHGMRPTDDELTAFYDEVLTAIRHPVTLAVNPLVGYTPNPRVIADICQRYTQVVAVRLSSLPDTYLINLQDMISRDVDYYVQLPGSMNTLALGAKALFTSECNIIPKTSRSYLDLYEKGDFQGASVVYAHLQRFNQYATKWGPAGARWLKMAMKALKLPGGEGGLRAPYKMPPEPEMKRFTDGLLALRVPEVDELARAAGLSIPGA